LNRGISAKIQRANNIEKGSLPYSENEFGPRKDRAKDELNEGMILYIPGAKTDMMIAEKKKKGCYGVRI
jgi:hypothetical protein